MRVVALGLAVAAGPAFAQDSCENAITTVELNACAHDLWQAADGELNQAYQAALAWARDWDEGEVLADYQQPARAEERLRAAQRAWLAFRDAACDALPWNFGGGSAATMNHYGCLEGLTRDRTEMLQWYTDD